MSFVIMLAHSESSAVLLMLIVSWNRDQSGAGERSRCHQRGLFSAPERLFNLYRHHFLLTAYIFKPRRAYIYSIAGKK